MSALPQSPRSILNVYAYLISPSCPFFQPALAHPLKADPESYYLSEGDYHRLRNALLKTESLILRTLSFTTHVSLPHHLALTYLQTLGVIGSTTSPQSSHDLAKRTLAHLNTGLLSPQLLYLTHQPPALAVAAIYLAAREIGVTLPRVEWWEVFDVDREELGFLVVGMGSMEGWAKDVGAKWEGRRFPLTVGELQAEIQKQEDIAA